VLDEMLQRYREWFASGKQRKYLMDCIKMHHGNIMEKPGGRQKSSIATNLVTSLMLVRTGIHTHRRASTRALQIVARFIIPL
jgi:hypothetical protein